MIPDSLRSQIEHLHTDQLKIVLVTGVFDVLHEKHIEFLRDAQAIGDFLIVGIEPDVRVKKMKGEERPYYSQDLRLRHIQDLRIADFAFILSENFGDPQERENLIREIRPTFLAVSSHSPYQKEKDALLQKYGGKLIVVTQYDPEFSSTKLLAEMHNK